MRGQFKYNLQKLALLSLIVLAAPFVFAQWNNPPTTPPTQNVFDVVHVGAGTQAKVGNLVADIFAATTEMRSNSYCDALGGNCFTPASMGGSGGSSITRLTAGSGIVLTPSIITATGTISMDTNVVQRRVTGCPSGQIIRQINADGTVVCQVVATSCAWNGVTQADGYRCRHSSGSCSSGTQYYYRTCSSGVWTFSSQCTLSTPSTPVC